MPASIVLLDTESHARNNLINYNEISFYQSGKDVVIGKYRAYFLMMTSLPFFIITAQSYSTEF